MKRRLISGKPSIPNHVRYAAAVFVVGMIVGVIITYITAERLVAGLPADEVFEAMRRDVRAFEYLLIGWGITFVVSSASAVAVWYRLYDRYALREDDKLGQSRVGES